MRLFVHYTKRKGFCSVAARRGLPLDRLELLPGALALQLVLGLGLAQRPLDGVGVALQRGRLLKAPHALARAVEPRVGGALALQRAHVAAH